MNVTDKQSKLYRVQSTPHTYDNTFVDSPGKLLVNIFGLSGKGVGIEPVQQWNIHSQSNLRILRRMNVSVTETRREKLEFRKTHHVHRRWVEALLCQPASIITSNADNL